ncbi:MAG: FkbM family methyltransferase [Henriciella sp.]|nr:FkbM family methyltransferase [Henriciella sp.]
MTQSSPSQSYAPGPLTAALLGLSRHTLFGRGQLRKLMAKGVRALNPETPLDVSLYGGRARLHHTGNNSEVKALLSPKRFSREEYAFCAEHMPAEGGVFLDIGANAGIFSLYVASLMRSGTLICVEPQPAMFERLQTNFALNPELEARLDVQLKPTALGAEAGELNLSVPTDSAGRASLHALAEGETLSVPVIPMLDLFQGPCTDRLDLLKIDVEGFEDAILFPFFETAPETLYPKAIVMEHCHAGRWARDCEAMLLGHGYDIAHKDRLNLMLRKR